MLMEGHNQRPAGVNSSGMLLASQLAYARQMHVNQVAENMYVAKIAAQTPTGAADYIVVVKNTATDGTHIAIPSMVIKDSVGGAGDGVEILIGGVVGDYASVAGAVAVTPANMCGGSTNVLSCDVYQDNDFTAVVTYEGKQVISLPIFTTWVNWSFGAGIILPPGAFLLLKDVSAMTNFEAIIRMMAYKPDELD